MSIGKKELYYLIIIIFTFFFNLSLGFKIVVSNLNFKNLGKSKLYSIVRSHIIWIMIFIYFCIFSLLSVKKFHAYNMAMVDLGRMDQAIWNTLHGRPFYCTTEFGNVSRLIMHSEFIYLLIAPSYLFFSSPKTILILQTLVVSLGALPIFLLSRERLNSTFSALCFSCAYLLYPALQYGNLNDFHPDMLATTFLLFTFFYLEHKRWLKYFVFLLLALMCKEYVSLVILMLSIYIFISQRNFKIAGITFILAMFWFLMTYRFIPLYLHGKENLMLEYYGFLGPSIGAIIKNMILHPSSALPIIFTFNNIANLMFLLLPIGFLSLLSLNTLFIGLPLLVGLMLSPFFSYANHHNGTIIPFIFISSIFAGGYLVNKFKHRFRNIAYGVAIFVFLNSLFSNIFYGPSPLSWRFWDKTSYRHWDSLQQFKVTQHDKLADKFVKMIPRDAPVSASNHLASHLSQRETIYHFPYPEDINRVDYVLVDLLEYFPTSWNTRTKEIDALRGLIYNNNFSLSLWDDGILLFKKSPRKENEHSLRLDKVREAFPQNVLMHSFDERLLLIGYDLKVKDFKRGEKYQIVYYWKILENFRKSFSYSYFGTTEYDNKRYILIDILENGRNRIRIIHLPMYLLSFQEDWKAGDIIKEEYDFSLPEDIPPDNYTWRTGMYAAPDFFFIQTETEGLVPNTKEKILGAIGIN